MSARGWALFASQAVIWGIPYLFIKIAVDELSPGFVAWSRVALAAAILLPLAWRSGALRGLPLRWLVAFAIAEITVPFPLIAFGEEHLSSSLTAILIAAVPLMVAFLAIRFDHTERPSRSRFAGMLVGLTGVVALVGIDVAGTPIELLGALAILVATVGYAAGPMLVKRHFAEADPIGPVAAALGIATVLLAPAALAGLPTAAPSAEASASIVVLGLVCTAVAFLLFFRLITEVGPSRASIITYVNPVVALALGVAVLGESITAGTVVGLLLILAGSWLATDGRLPPGLAQLVNRRRAVSPAEPKPAPARELSLDPRLRWAPEPARPRP